VKIKILPKDVYSLIAAGEIIDRPASIVRELIQNSIDAESDSIVLEISGGGKEKIIVMDNGSGMSKEDLEVCWLPHSTSKIREADDLNSITTYGFRGEALNAVSSVSSLEIESCIPGEESGNRVLVREGNLIESVISPILKGTTVSVNKLFMNLPARKRFMKSDNTEMNYCEREFRMHALANEGIDFKLISDGRSVHNYKKCDIAKRIQDIEGKEFLDNCYKIDHYHKGIHITGYVGKPGVTDSKKYAISHLFVNKRFVTHPMVKRAVYSAFGTQMSNRFCPYIIFIETDPANFDINIHPAKKEIKFADENNFYVAMNQAVKNSVKIDAYISENSFATDFSSISESSLSMQTDNVQDQMLFAPGEINRSGMQFESRYEERSPFWQFAKTYIMVELKEKLYMIDQHAAHERIMYEKFLSSEEITTQKLLFPINMKLDADMFELLKENESVFTDMGFQVREIGKRHILIDGIPSVINEKFDADDFLGILEDIREKGDSDIRDGFVKIVACRSAIKANRELTKGEMIAIVTELFECREPQHCPHGRPTYIIYLKSEIDTWFKRT